jgi:hypothetical protein
LVDLVDSSRIKWLTRIVYSQTFELGIAAIIFLNAIALALLTIPGIDDQTRDFRERAYCSNDFIWQKAMELL